MFRIPRKTKSSKRRTSPHHGRYRASVARRITHQRFAKRFFCLREPPAVVARFISILTRAALNKTVDISRASRAPEAEQVSMLRCEYSRHGIGANNVLAGRSWQAAGAASEPMNRQQHRKRVCTESGRNGVSVAQSSGGQVRGVSSRRQAGGYLLNQSRNPTAKYRPTIWGAPVVKSEPRRCWAAPPMVC